MDDQNLLALTVISDFRSSGMELKIVGKGVGWVPKSAKPTLAQLDSLKKHKPAILDELRRRKSAVPVSPAGGAGGAADEDRRSASNAGGVNPFVTADAASSPTILVAPPLDASGKTKAALARDEELKRTRPHIWRVIHGNEAAVQAEVQAELDEQRTREMLVALGVRTHV